MTEIYMKVAAGLPGDAATIEIESTTTLAEGQSATAVNNGTDQAASIAFGIPRGAIPAVGWNFDTSTSDADPGDGDVRFNNADPASVTEIYFDNEDRDGNDVSAWLDTFDDADTAITGTITFTPAAAPSGKLVYNVTGAVTDGTGYRKVAVTHVAGTTLPSSGAHLGVTFSRSGNNGINGAVAVDGTPSAGNLTSWNDATTVEDSGIAVADVVTADSTTTLTNKTFDANGTGNSISNIEVADLASAAKTGADTAVVTGTAGSNDKLAKWNSDGDAVEGPDAVNPQFTTIELGHASDTTISRSASGVIAVEGVEINPSIPLTSKSEAYTLTLAEANEGILHPTADNNARTFTIPANGSVAYPVGTTLTFVNQINTVTIAITTDTLTLAGVGSTGSRTLAAGGMATAIKVTSTIWFISGSGLS